MTQYRANPLEVAEQLTTAFGVPQALLVELTRLHARQWDLEDQSRAAYVTDEQIGEAKRAIDRSNSRRHRLINAIDAAVRPKPLRHPARLYSETVGELCDRLLIFDLKLRAVSDPAPIHAACEHLAAVVHQIVVDVATGRAALPPRVGVKVYNGTACEELMR